MDKLDILQNSINYHFKDIKNLETSLIHPSYANEHNIEKYKTNQRLEFLGDAVLELISSNYLFEKYPYDDEGSLTKKRANLVCEETLSFVAKKLKLYNHIFTGKGETLEKVIDNNSILSDALESIIGAIYIDSNIEEAKKFIIDFILSNEEVSKNIIDYKSKIREYANEKNKNLSYLELNEYGPDHKKTFEIEIIYDVNYKAIGIGHSKKEAEQNAAKKLIEILNI